MTTEGFRVSIGDFFTPNAGGYFAQFISWKMGPRFKNTDRPGDRASIRWQFRLWNQDGTPVIDPKTGDFGAAEGLTGDSLGIGRGTIAKGRIWLTALRKGKGLEWIEPNQVNATALVEECFGAVAWVTYGVKPGKTRVELLEIQALMPGVQLPQFQLPTPVQQMPAQQPMAPATYAAPPAPAAPQMSTAPVMPAAAPPMPTAPVTAPPMPVAPAMPVATAVATAPAAAYPPTVPMPIPFPTA